ncbi:class I SAM-dependent methyltransferase [Streptomyces lonarensis]|uniref:Methyltransferase domain-containing protein n=1 Tax=Streptomyces lonarensis TaxID=700599 RepID=A0A7X6HY51_9ACTN|nr:class I SAM-dependent methyltransferase [Streptomyces lonarensis]NJQ05246.1 methyltransferase domain-containing protein [Streptomyces lonarensis]
MTAETAYHGPLGELFAAQATDSAYNAHTDRPAMLELAGDVTDLRVLDLGCGAGHYAAELVARGAAAVTGVDGSASLLDAARERLAGTPADRVGLHLHDLERPLDFLPDASVDLAVVALVHHHLERRAEFLAEVHRVVRPGGALVLSTTHPTADWLYFGGSYFDEERVRLPLGDGHALDYRRLTMETVLGELLAAGFVLEQLREPRGTDAARVVDERRWRKTHRQPMFLALRLRRP